MWAYATADESHPKLFEKVADHIVNVENRDIEDIINDILKCIK